MKRLAAVLAMAAASVTLVAQTEVRFDKFKNITRFDSATADAGPVTIDSGKDASPLIHRMEVNFGFVCPGQAASCLPENIQMLFEAHTSTWVMQGTKETVRLLIDGSPETMEEGATDGQVLGPDDLREYRVVSVSTAMFNRMANAKTIEVQIGMFEFSFTQGNLASLRDLARYCTAASAAR
jgi:hypothetical protein